MKKHICGFAALVALVFTFTGSAYAEGIIGAQYGRSYVELTPGQDTKGHGSRAGKFQSGAFAQYRNGALGLHFAVNTGSVKISALEKNGKTVKAEFGRSYDLLGMLVIEGEKISGIGMLGISGIERETSGFFRNSNETTTENDPIYGLKYAVGLEIPFANDDWVFQVVSQRTELEEFGFEIKQSGFRLRIGKRF